MNESYAAIRVPLIFGTIILWIITFMIAYLTWRSASSEPTFCFCFSEHSFFAILFGAPFFWASIVLTLTTIVVEIVARVSARSPSKGEMR
jgi:predicted membrane protein